MKKKTLSALVASLAVLFTVLLTGCGSAANDTSVSPTDKGYLTLSVNPEIRIEYNAEGLVTGLEGRNNDGKAIVAGYADYIGKDCGAVLKELVTHIHEAGYFIEDADGGKRQIVLQVEPGSALPDDDFLELLSRDVQGTVSDLALKSDVVDIDSDDYDQRYAKENQPSPYITLEKAKEIALTHAGVSADAARWDDREFDFENGQPIFELEFSANGTEYEYDIDATDGKILRSKTDRDDDRPASSPANTTGKTSTSTDKPAASTDKTPSSSKVTSSDKTSASPYIGLEKARAIALEKAGVSAADAVWEDRGFDLDDGTPLYELEFRAGGVEYECDVHAESGKVVSFERDRDDDRDDRYDSDDWDDRYDDDWDD